MKGALGKKELLAVVPLSWSTIDRMERAGEFPKRWYITDKRCAWNRDEVERWLDERQAASPAVQLHPGYALDIGGLTNAFSNAPLSLTDNQGRERAA